MSGFRWDKAKKYNDAIDLNDEKSDFRNDEAARWLSENAPAPSRASRKKARKKASQRQHKALSEPDSGQGFVIYTDGACIPNPGRGGWGFVVYHDGIEIYADCGGARKSTNNEMEMTALLKAVEWASANAKGARIFSDSSYVVNGCNDWRFKWKANGWRRYADKKRRALEPIKNAELWQDIDLALRGAAVKVGWCKGHAGIVGNERADKLSVEGRRRARLQPAPNPDHAADNP